MLKNLSGKTIPAGSVIKLPLWLTLSGFNHLDSDSVAIYESSDGGFEIDFKRDRTIDVKMFVSEAREFLYCTDNGWSGHPALSKLRTRVNDALRLSDAEDFVNNRPKYRV